MVKKIIPSPGKGKEVIRDFEFKIAKFTEVPTALDIEGFASSSWKIKVNKFGNVIQNSKEDIIGDFPNHEVLNMKANEVFVNKSILD